ncbi:MAG: glycosyltransferase family 39 protein [Candidatus Levybacteria bacterium]|nr:glycosyltransferase family 39 protein [Candidatus Levybacteria bacterium]
MGLSAFPNGFARDEAYLGYNAFSILQTGRDINGNFLPLFIESFLYTPAGYAYLTIPFIKLFGLNIFSIRIVSAIFGALTIPLMFLLVRSLFNIENKVDYTRKFVITIGILSSLFLAISPWHINLSRTASVTTVVVFLIMLATVFLSTWLVKPEKKFIIIAYFLYTFSLFFYIAPYSFIPFFILLFFVIYKRKIHLKKIFLVLFFLMIVPIIVTYTNSNFSLRVKSLSLTNHAIIPIILTENASRDGVVGIKPFVSRIFHNKVTVLSDLYITNYAKHLSYDFLFNDEGFPDRYRIPETGLFYPIFAVFIVMGIFILFKKENKASWFLLGWILISPIGSSFANDDVPNAQRILFMLPPLIIFASVGFAVLILNLNSIIRKVLVVIVFLIFFYQVIFYFHQYYIHENAYRPWYRQEGYQELVEKINLIKGNYKKIVVTNRESGPTLFLSFFSEYNPKELQKTISKSELRDTDRISFDMYTITEEECPVHIEIDQPTKKPILKGEEGVLYINSGLCKIDELPNLVRRLGNISRSDGSVAFYLLDIK